MLFHPCFLLSFFEYGGQVRKGQRRDLPGNSGGRAYLLEALSLVVIVTHMPLRLDSCSNLWRR